MKALLGIVVALILVGMVFGSSDNERGGGGGGDDSSDDGFMAQVMCEEFVKKRLKSPSSAEFSDQEHAESTYGWRVTGVVDSENSFGAMLRADYVCEVKNVGGDEWRAKSVDLVPR